MRSLLASLVLPYDPHSYYRADMPTMTHLDWDVRVDFTTHTLTGVATISFDKAGSTVLDTRDLTIHRITTSTGDNIPFKIGKSDSVIGAPLSFEVPDSNQVIIHYITSPNASAAQWLGDTCFYTQSQEIHARSLYPCQDTPGVRCTFNVAVTIPAHLRGLMGGEHISRTDNGDGTATEKWQMKHAIQSYLVAIVVGNLVSRDLGDRCRVWAEPDVIEAAAWEFEEAEAMVAAGEEIGGPYQWGRFDFLIMPKSFAFGGMEIPLLTLLTPTLISGDRTQVSVLEHEGGHAWTGNLVTNTNVQHFWLNEGWTVYFEWRIAEARRGIDQANLERAVFLRELVRSLGDFSADGRPEMTCLRTHVNGTVDPDEAFSRVPYAKGALFLMALEAQVGRAVFDAFILKYIQAFAFKSIDTKAFLRFLEEHLPGAFAAIRGWEWVYEPGVPFESCPEVISPLIDEVAQFADSGLIPAVTDAEHWNALQWTLYLETLRDDITVTNVELLDERFQLSSRKNIEVRWAYLLLRIKHNCATPDQLMTFAVCTGRLKHLKPLFRGLVARQENIPVARTLFDAIKEGLHSTAAKVFGGIIEAAEKAVV